AGNSGALKLRPAPARPFYYTKLDLSHRTARLDLAIHEANHPKTNPKQCLDVTVHHGCAGQTAHDTDSVALMPTVPTPERLLRRRAPRAYLFPLPGSRACRWCKRQASRTSRAP